MITIASHAAPSPSDAFLQRHIAAVAEAPVYGGPKPTGIIGLGGPAAVGKDTAGYLLGRYFERFGTVYVTSFAEPLYEMIAAMTGMTVAQLKDRKIKELPIDWPGAPRGLEKWTIRRLLQFFGTEVVRTHLGYDFWVHRLLERVAKIQPNIVIITDVRFENEIKVCDATIELERTGFAYPNDHASAQRMPLQRTVNLDQPDYVELAQVAIELLPA